MKITEFKSAHDKLAAEQVVCVLTASTFENGYWKYYHASAYRVVNIVSYEINLQNINHLEEWLRLGEDELKSGRFYIEF